MPDSGGWHSEANRIAILLRSGAPGALSSAVGLLELQRTYAARTGDAHSVVMSLSNFAGAYNRRDVAQAESWAREAIWWQPSEASGWTALVQAITLQDPLRGVALAWSAAARFPDNPHVLRALSRALEIAELLEAARLVAQYDARRFPGRGHSRVKAGRDDPVARAKILEESPDAVVGEARIRRREARATHGEAAEKLMASARGLIELMALTWPTHPALGREAGLVGVLLPASTPSLADDYLAARADRESKRGKRMRTDADIDDLVAPWKRLREADEATRPGALLGQARACLAATDGAALADEARFAFAQLATWGLGHRRDYVLNTFETNWFTCLTEIVDVEHAAGKDVGLLAAVEALHRTTLDELEEDAVVPLERSSSFDPRAAHSPVDA